MADDVPSSPVAVVSGLGRSTGPGGVCPCGGVPQGSPYDSCCGPIVAGEVAASTAEALMRSRYSAYAVGSGDHLFRTWHPRTRPDDVDPDGRVRWVGLDVIDCVAGGPDDSEGVVEFRAHWVSDDDGPTRRGEVHERSAFVRRAGRWVYLRTE